MSSDECEDCGETFEQLHPTGRCFVCVDIAIKAQDWAKINKDNGPPKKPGRPRIYTDEERQQKMKDYQYKYRTGIGRETYASLLEAQHGMCALCGIQTELMKAQIILVLVCYSCKTFLRHAYTKPDILDKAKELLAEFLPRTSLETPDDLKVK